MMSEHNMDYWSLIMDDNDGGEDDDMMLMMMVATEFIFLHAMRLFIPEN